MNYRVSADAWCAAFVWPKHEGAPEAPTDQVFRALRSRDQSTVSESTRAEILRLRDQYHFFHWHLEFPEVFSVPESDAGVQRGTGWVGGFDAVVGNPPWERVKLQEQEFFAQRDPAIAKAKNAAARKRLITELCNNPDGARLYTEFEAAKRRAEGESHFLRLSNRFPLTGRGDINTYAVFAETDRTLTGPRGRAGAIVPTGIATDATTQFFFKELVKHKSLTALFDFENATPLFSDVHRSFKFCVLSLTGSEIPEATARFGFFLHDPAELADSEKTFPLTPEEIALLNPNTGTCPVFRSRRDAEITLGVYRRVPVLVNETKRTGGNPWGISFMTMFHMSNDSHLFRPDIQNGETFDDLLRDGWHLDGNVLVRGEECLLPLYEAKMLHHYDHRWGTYTEDGSVRDFNLAEKQDAVAVPMPRYWVPENDISTGKFDKNGQEIKEPGVASRLTSKGWHREWLLGWRDICRATDERTGIVGLFPRIGVGNNLPISILDANDPGAISALTACASSFVFDFTARFKVGGTHLNFFITYQLPVPKPEQLAPHITFILPRILELTYTAYGMARFARDLGDTGTPIRWHEDRRAVIRAELDALFFHLYGINCDDVSYILDTFPIVKRKDEEKFGEYRTKRLVLAEYDRMAAAGLTMETPLVEGESGTYRSTLTPPPGQGPRHPDPAPTPAPGAHP
jgi:hypothetical protein